MKKVLMIICIIVVVCLLMGGCILVCGIIASNSLKKEMPKIVETMKKKIGGDLETSEERAQLEELGNQPNNTREAFEMLKKRIAGEAQPPADYTPEERARLEELGNQLIRAVARNDIQTVRDLLQQGALVNIEEPGRLYTPLIVAAQRDYTKMAALLINAGADVNAQLADTAEQNKMSSLLFAADNGNVQLAYMLIKAGASVYLADSRGFTPLHRACLMGHPNVAQLLLQAGVDINVVSSLSQTTSLMVAAYAGQVDTVQFLLQKGADPYLQDRNGGTALDYARESNSPNKEKIIALLQQAQKRA
ncbi:MAG: ankyrin repeat domain-containing protein [Elusimicrobiaceae bacterium]|nr:ankyrin repeat domain-containing protein [Elusimicrobiaceae bacterium]